MKKSIFVLIAFLLLGVSINAQTAPATSGGAIQTQTDAKPKRQIFRANKEQISTVQKMLKENGLY